MQRHGKARSPPTWRARAGKHQPQRRRQEKPEARSRQMQLRRSPRRDGQLKATRLKVLQAIPAGGHDAATVAKGWRRADSYFGRMLAGSIGVSVPIFVAVGILVTSFAIQTSTDQAGARSQALAQAAAYRVDDWVVERNGELRQLARDAGGRVTGADAGTTAEVNAHISNFYHIQILHPAGHLLPTPPHTSRTPP